MGLVRPGELPTELHCEVRMRPRPEGARTFGRARNDHARAATMHAVRRPGEEVLDSGVGIATLPLVALVVILPLCTGTVDGLMPSWGVVSLALLASGLLWKRRNLYQWRRALSTPSPGVPLLGHARPAAWKCWEVVAGHTSWYHVEPVQVDYGLLDISLCGALGLPGVLHFVMHNSWFMLAHGIVIATLSVLADGLQKSEFLVADRIGAGSTFVLWFAHGLRLVRRMSPLFVLYMCVIVGSSVLCQRKAAYMFYKEKDSRSGVVLQRLWHVGALCSMGSLLVASN